MAGQNMKKTLSFDIDNTLQNSIYTTLTKTEFHKTDEDFKNNHNNLGDGGFRAAILGFSDGMISNLLLILGVQFALEEADGEAAYIIETGISGLVASTISMGIGEWIAMTNECEAVKAEIKVERKHLDKYWDQESTTLRNIFRDHGISTETLNKMKRDLNNAPKDKVVDLHLKMKLGIDVDDVGSPLKAGLFSAICTGSGAFVPISPYLIFDHDKGWIAAIILTSIIGISLGFITGKIAKINPFVTSIRQIAGIIIAVSLALLVNYFGVSQIPDDFKTLSYI